MNKIEVFPKSTLRISKHNRKAVSDVVAVLILIVIAIIGAVAVGLILSTTGHSVGNQAANGGNGNSAQTQLFVGGSTTVYPITEAGKATFQSKYHIDLIDAQGGSDGGMQGVISGALDVGAASSASAVNNAQVDVTNNNLVGVTITPTLIGGSAIVVIENGAGNATYPGFLTDGSNPCLGVTARALYDIFTNATFGIVAGSCDKSHFYTLEANGVTTGSLVPVSRSDDSGTQDQFSKFTGLTKQSSGGNLPGNTQPGNAGVLNFVNKNSGTIGFVDLGFAEGAASGSVCPAGWTATHVCGVALPEAVTNNPASKLYNGATTSFGTNGKAISECAGKARCTTGSTNSSYASFDGFVSLSTGSSGSTANVHNAIITALKSASQVNPLTLSGSVAIFPDNVQGTSTTGLARTFYYVTNGSPTPTEQTFISFYTSPNAESYYTSNGFFSQYDITQA